MLLRQEVQEPGIYNEIIETIACGASKANEISTKIGEETAKCLKYIKTLCELGILYKETPFDEKDTSRKTIYKISDFMFRFWFRYVFTNRTLIESGTDEAVLKQRVLPDYSFYMGHAFEKICMEWMLRKNAAGELPFLFTSIGRWWGVNPASLEHEPIEIDFVAKDGKDYMFGECKWRNEKMGAAVLDDLQRKADIFREERKNTYFFLFSKSGFSKALYQKAESDQRIVLVGLGELLE